MAYILCMFCVQSLRDDIDHQFNTGKWTWDDVRPNDAAGLLKQFVRDLPSPLLTWECVESFSKLQSVYCSLYCIFVTDSL